MSNTTTTPDNLITNAKERMEKLQEFSQDVLNIFNAFGVVNLETKKARMLFTSACAIEYRHNPDPVIWIASMRGDLQEINDFIEKCKAQLS